MTALETAIPTDDVVARIHEIAKLSGIKIADSGKDFIIIPYEDNPDFVKPRQNLFAGMGHAWRGWVKFTPTKMSIRIQRWNSRKLGLWQRLWGDPQELNAQRKTFPQVTSLTYSMNQRRGFRLIVSNRGDSYDASKILDKHNLFAQMLGTMTQETPEIEEFVSLWLESHDLEDETDLQQLLMRNVLVHDYKYAVMDNLALPFQGWVPGYFRHWTNVSDYTEELFGEHADKTFRRLTLKKLQFEVKNLESLAKSAMTWIEVGYPLEVAHFVYEHQIQLKSIFLGFLDNSAEIFKKLGFSTKRVMRLLDLTAGENSNWRSNDTIHMIHQAFRFVEEDPEDYGKQELMELSKCRTWDELHDAADMIRRAQNRRRAAERNKRLLEPYPDPAGALKTFSVEFEFNGRQLMVLPPLNGVEQMKWSDEMDHCIGSYADEMYQRDCRSIFLGVYDSDTCELQYNVEVLRSRHTTWLLNQFRGRYNAAPPEGLVSSWISFMQESRGVKVETRSWY